MNTLLRYMLAAIGPISSAGVQFLLSLVLIHALPPAQFGSFSFLLVLSQFSSGIAMALFCAPLLIVLHHDPQDGREQTVAAMFTGNLAFSAGIGAVALACGLLLGIGTAAAALFGVYAAIYLLRWYGRAFAYAEGHPLRTTASDLTYAFVLVVGVGALWWSGQSSLEHIYIVLIAGAALGLIPFGAAYLRRQFAVPGRGASAAYGGVWRAHARWSLLGVLSTEATVNAHAYLVTAIAGPTAFAPIAASALLLRPLTVGTNALSEFERARLARLIGARDAVGTRRAVRGFRLVLVAVWTATAAAAAAILAFAPHLLFPARYSLSFLEIGAALWMAIGLIRMVRAPDSALLQAGGRFRPLAMASVASAGVSVGGVLVLLLLGGPLWSIAGLLAGEAVYAYRTGRLLRGTTARQGADADAILFEPTG